MAPKLCSQSRAMTIRRPIPPRWTRTLVFMRRQRSPCGKTARSPTGDRVVTGVEPPGRRGRWAASDHATTVKLTKHYRMADGLVASSRWRSVDPERPTTARQLDLAPMRRRRHRTDLGAQWRKITGCTASMTTPSLARRSRWRSWRRACWALHDRQPHPRGEAALCVGAGSGISATRRRV